MQQPLQSVASELRTIVGGAFALRPEAFLAAVRVPDGWYFTTAVILIAGFSDSIGQSVVLFANKVKSARFIFSLLVNAVLFAFGYLFLVASTWLVMRVPGRPHVAFGDLAVVLALSYLPYWFAFLVALPYLGNGINWLLRTLHLVAMVVAVSALGHIGPFAALVCVGIGWFALSIAQQTFGRPVAVLGEKLLDAVAGVQVTSNEQLAIDRLPADSVPHAVDGTAEPITARHSLTTSARQHSSWWKVALGIGFMLAIGYVCAVTLAPVHHAVFGWQDRLPRAAQLPLDLLWIGLIGILVAGFMAPVETLGWWAGWYGDDIDNAARNAEPKGRGDGGKISRYIVYLDGIAQSGQKYTPDVERFLDALAARLTKTTRLVRGVMTYSVLNKPLDDDPVLSWFWRWVDAVRFANPKSLLGMVINIRNVLIVAVSADTRYGPIYNYGIAQIVYDALIANGYRRNSGTPVTFVGYSGGGQMAAASAAYVSRAIDAPVDVISLGGVISGSCRILEIEHLYHFIGSRDGVQRLGPIMFPSRWKTAVISNWNRALRLGRLSIFGLGPVGHQVPGGMFDPSLTLPDGRTALQQTIDKIDDVLHGRVAPPQSLMPVVPNNYDSYRASPYNQPATYPIATSIDLKLYKPQSEWMGRLILPALEERKAVRGAWFEVHHAPAAAQNLVGKRVRLRWADDPLTAELIRAVTRDVYFSAQAEYTSREKGLIQPVRLDHWQLVDPLESLAGAHPVDDLIVSLNGPVAIADSAEPILEITRQPMQITGRYRGLVQFSTRVGDEEHVVIHFNAVSRAFDGARETVVLPKVVPDSGGRDPSIAPDLATSELNAEGWYVYGSLNAQGAFVVQALLPRRMLALAPQRTIAAADAYRYVHREVWKEIVAQPGAALSVQLGDSDWKVGDRALVTHVYGGIGGAKGERASSGPVYFGHFAFGFAEVVLEELTQEPRFDLMFEQIYTQNVDGLIAGALHMSRYLGDRQFGWAGLRPTCNVLLKLDSFTGDFQIGGRRGGALDGFFTQLEAMTARYRIGDGTGCTYVGAANNCSQDSNRALFAALEGLEEFVDSPAFVQWKAANTPDAARFSRLVALGTALEKQLSPFGSARRDWSENQFNLGTTMSDDPLDQLKAGLASWRVILPRLANDTIVKTFLKNGATARVITTNQLGARDGIAPVVPLTL